MTPNLCVHEVKCDLEQGKHQGEFWYQSVGKGQEKQVYWATRSPNHWENVFIWNRCLPAHAGLSGHGGAWGWRRRLVGPAVIWTFQVMDDLSVTQTTFSNVTQWSRLTQIPSPQPYKQSTQCDWCWVKQEIEEVKSLSQCSNRWTHNLQQLRTLELPLPQVWSACLQDCCAVRSNNAKTWRLKVWRKLRLVFFFPACLERHQCCHFHIYTEHKNAESGKFIKPFKDVRDTSIQHHYDVWVWNYTRWYLSKPCSNQIRRLRLSDALSRTRLQSVLWCAMTARRQCLKLIWQFGWRDHRLVTQFLNFLACNEENQREAQGIICLNVLYQGLSRHFDSVSFENKDFIQMLSHQGVSLHSQG